MNQDTHSFSTQQKNISNQFNIDEFNLDEDSFKPMTKGLGFHNDQKKSNFKPVHKEVKPFASSKKVPSTGAMLNSLDAKNSSIVAQQLPSGLEAFYESKTKVKPESLSLSKAEVGSIKKIDNSVSMAVQFFAWAIDLLLVASFVAITGLFLVMVSGIEFNVFIRLISTNDLIAFGSSLFAIYYLLYFTILDLSTSPGKTIMGVRLIRTDDLSLGVKHTFTRALVTLVSAVALFLPLVLDFQGRLSDTKVVK